MSLENIVTDRLILMPYTIKLASGVLENRWEEVYNNELQPGEGWPDEDTLETMPRILSNLQLVGDPTGFESWMVVKKQGMKIIGDVGFKGVPNADGQVDIGYGIIKAERKKGYAVEAAKGLAKWAFNNENVKAVTAKCFIHNADSAKVLEKMCFKEVSRDGEMIYWILAKEDAATL